EQSGLQHAGARAAARIDGARREPPARAPRRRRGRRRRADRLRAGAADRRHHDPSEHGGGRGIRRRAAPPARRAGLRAPRAALLALLPGRRFPADRPPLPARRLGRQAKPRAPAVATPAMTGRRPRRQRRLALGLLLAAAGVGVAAFPRRATWWGGWILAIAEAGIVGGLADWFAVTAIFRRPLGLPIPHTALIPANWELMAARVGTMVGSRVLTEEYDAREIPPFDRASVIARGAER